MTGGGAAAPETLWVFKESTTNLGSTSVWKDLWKNRGIPGEGTIPGTVAAPTSSTAGAIPFTNAGGGRTKFAVQATAWAAETSGTALMLYDRLLHIGGLSNTSSASQTVGGTITRNTGGVGNEIWLVLEGSSSTPKDCTITYTNQAGTGSRSTTLEVFNLVNSADTLYRFPLQAGDYGVQSVQSMQFANTVGTNTSAIVIARPLMMLGSRGKPLIEPPWPVIDDNACLALAMRSVGQGPITACIATAER